MEVCLIFHEYLIFSWTPYYDELTYKNSKTYIVKGYYMKLITKHVLAALLGLLTVTVHVAAQAEGLVLTGPPRETPAAGLKMYGPIADHLTKALGVPVTYVHPGNWLKYQREMRGDKYDIIFDGPHFISWRIEHLGHEALVKLPGKLQFMMVSKVGREEYKHPDELIGKRICGISSPNLSTLSILDYYRNPVRQPTIKGIKGGMPKVYKTLVNDKAGCNAAVLRTAFFKKKLKKEQREGLKTIILGKVMPNQGISVSKRVSERHKIIISNELTVGKGVGSTKGIRKRFAGKAKSFIPVQSSDYVGYNNLLEGVIFGW